MNNHALTKKRSFGDTLLSYGFYILFLLLITACSVLSPVFLTGENLLQILWGATTILVAAAGGTFVVITGNMDMSIGSTALCSMAVAVYAGQRGATFSEMIIIAFAVGLTVGVVNGLLVTCLKLNSMLTTLGMMIALRGLSLNLTNGGAQVTLSPEFKQVAGVKIFGLSWLIVTSVAIMLLLQFILRKTRFGAYCYAIGCNEDSSRRIGLPIRRVKMAVYVLSGLCAAFVGLVSCCKLGTFSGTIGQDMEFDVVSVCVIGGTSLLGGRGNIFPGTFVGVLLLYLINNGLALSGASPFLYPFAKGLVIFVAMYVDALKNFRKK